MDGSLLLLGVEGIKLTEEEVARFQELQPAGYILFSRNVKEAEQVRALTDHLTELSEIPPIICIDHEGGRVERTSEIAPTLPSASAFAANPDTAQIVRAGEATADLLSLLGINLNLSPVLDVDYYPERQNSLNQRCWGTDIQDVIDRAGIFNRWMRRRGMRSCGKHFPACGRATIDPHQDLPSSLATKEEMMESDIIPYTALMSELDAVMMAHIHFPKIDEHLPASLSPRVITDWLRGQLGFDKHLLMTDDLDMGAVADRYSGGEAARLAIAAGNDLAMICHRAESAKMAAEAIGKLSIYRREESHKRVRKFRKKLKTPPPFNQQRWDHVCDQIRAIAEVIPEVSEADTRSDVTRY